MKYLVMICLCLGLLIVTSSMRQKMESELPSLNELEKVDRIMYRFIAKAAKQIGEKYNMSQCSTGGGTKNEIWLMSFDFQKYSGPFNEEQSRKLIVSCLQDYLNLVNQDEELRPFLKVYPFKAENINVGIFISNNERRDFYYPNISVIKASQGKIGYFTNDELNCYKYKSEKYESYEEAIAILQKEKSNENQISQ